ncbi:transport system permease protein [Streptomyces bingchenggensis BCW-1]|uniref:Transport system permease protein n=1 Tax=Streptomyces bingchenggensis (strain BCW-1) TaxID=749414 RepID=D7C7X6_STRBB|nr:MULTISPECIES: ABC transporter permease subunit [Streptomyces]ADI04137.1 transport system permease protein [Streptomyces bingchenggensis BCW-1]
MAAALLCGIGLLPWLSRTDPARTVLEARSAERDPAPEVLAAVRDELGLDAGPLHLLGQWLGGLPRGDAGHSWISGEAVLPAVTTALGASLLLMAAALAVAVVTAAAVCARTLRLVAGLRRPSGQRPGAPRTGGAAAMLAALPEFLTASVLATVVGVQLGWLPALGWYGPRWLVLPALAIGLPTGALLGRMLDDALPGAFAEPWARAAAARGIPGRRIARHALRRCVPGLLPNFGLFVVGLTGGAVAVEQIFDIPGLGRLTLEAAIAQDLPVLQAGTLALVALAATVGGLARLAGRALLGPALRDGALVTLHRPTAPEPRTLPLLYGALLLGVIALGLARDPLALDTAARLQPPSWAHPFGTDALGRDLMARVGHGALTTLALALAVSATALLVGVALGLVPRVSQALVDTVNAVPAVLAGLLVTGVTGGGPATPALAVAAVAWAPLAAHTSALLRQELATTHLAATRALGAGRLHVLRRALLPAVLPPVTRHALLRLPSVALALASLGFLGLGAQPPSPEWGLLLAENHPYAERAPWAVLAPAAMLAVLGALAVTAAGGVRRPWPGRARRADQAPIAVRKQAR